MSDAVASLPDSPFSHALIVGCGDVGMRLARILLARGVEVSALARSETRAMEYAAAGLGVVRGDLDWGASLSPFAANGSAVFHFAPPPSTTYGDPRTSALLGALDHQVRPHVLVYASTSGVYGDCDGAWVREDAPLRPITERAQRRVDAENAVRAWGALTDVRTVVLRVPGIYGPGRLPIDSVRAGTPVVDPAHTGWTNRIHADDLARIAYLAAVRDAHGAYNVSDGTPGKWGDLSIAVAEVLGLPRPRVIPFSEAAERLTPMQLSFLMESRRLDIMRMLEELRPALLYPDVVEGVRASL